tara:strand:- start:5764 stop:7326 length:1563 start_codon:yes stop_codon:yes gene_type:complete
MSEQQTKAQLISTNILSGARFAGVVTATEGIDGGSGAVSGADANFTGDLGVSGDASISGVVTAQSFSGEGSALTGFTTTFITAVGVQSEGTSIGAGITQLNFVGSGNTFSVDGSTVNIGIRGKGVGIQSGGVLIGTGVTQFNFLGVGNSFAIVNDTVEITVGGSGQQSGDFNSGISSSVREVLTGVGATIFTAPATPVSARYVVRSIMASNVAAGTTEVNIIGAIDYEAASGIGSTDRSYFAYNVPISAGGAVEVLPQPIVLGPSDKVLMRSTDYTRSGISTIVDVHMTIEQQDDSNYFGFGLGDTSLATSNQTKTVYTSTDQPTVLQSIRACNKTNTGPHLISVYTQTAQQTFNIVSIAASTTNLDYYFTGSDRNGTLTDNTDTSFDVNQGDILRFDVSETYSSHPFSIVDAFGGAGFTTGVTGAGTSIVSWDTTNITPGTYRYECANHPNDMRGFIYVAAQAENEKPKYIVKNLIIPKYAVVELLEQPKRLEANMRLGVGNSTGQSIHLQVSGILVSE